MNRHVIWPIVVLMALGFIISCGGGGGGGGEPWAPVWVAKWDSGGGTEEAFALGLQDDGKILVAGSRNNPNADILLVRFNADGSLDTGFGTGGWVTWDGGSHDYGRGLALQADGKVLVVGTSYNGTDYDVVLLSYNANGTLDTGFGTEGLVTWDSGAHDFGKDITLQADGKILLVGESANDCLLIRYNADGTLDNGFGTSGSTTWNSGGGERERGRKVALQTDGKILVASILYGVESVDGLLLSYNANGTLDTGFGTGGSVTWDSGANDYWWALALQADGKILVGGDSDDGANKDATVLRFNADGSLDSGFGTNGLATWDNGWDDGVEGLTVLAGGKILATGWSHNGMDWDVLVLQLTMEGSLDAGFGTGGSVVWDGGYGDDVGFALEATTTGEILVAGVSDNGNDYDVLLLRIR